MAYDKRPVRFAKSTRDQPHDLARRIRLLTTRSLDPRLAIFTVTGARLVLFHRGRPQQASNLE
jgi:hypothetical protein